MNPDVYEMVPIEVGSLVWWSGYGILAAVIMALFWLAPRESEPKMAKWEKTLGWMILANLAWYTLMALWDGVYRADESLPIHMCGMSQILLFLHLVLKKKWAFPIVVFWGPLGGIQAFLTPALETEPTLGYVLQFYLAHASVVVVPVYLMVYGGRRIPRKSFWRVIGITNLVGFVMMGVNSALGSNYMYVNQPPPVDHPLVKGAWPYYLIGIEAAVIGLFWLFLLAFRKFREPKLD